MWPDPIDRVRSDAADALDETAVEAVAVAGWQALRRVGDFACEVPLWNAAPRVDQINMLADAQAVLDGKPPTNLAARYTEVFDAMTEMAAAMNG